MPHREFRTRMSLNGGWLSQFANAHKSAEGHKKDGKKQRIIIFTCIEPGK